MKNFATLSILFFAGLASYSPHAQELEIKIKKAQVSAEDKLAELQQNLPQVAERDIADIEARNVSEDAEDVEQVAKIQSALDELKIAQRAITIDRAIKNLVSIVNDEDQDKRVSYRHLRSEGNVLLLKKFMDANLYPVTSTAKRGLASLISDLEDQGKDNKPHRVFDSKQHNVLTSELEDLVSTEKSCRVSTKEVRQEESKLLRKHEELLATIESLKDSEPKSVPRDDDTAFRVTVLEEQAVALKEKIESLRVNCLNLAVEADDKVREMDAGTLSSEILHGAKVKYEEAIEGAEGLKKYVLKKDAE